MGTNVVADTDLRAWLPRRRLNIEDSVTNTVTTLFTLEHTSTGTVAANFGLRLLATLEDASGNTPENAGALDFIWADPDHGSEDCDLVISLKTAGAALAERHRFSSTGVYTPTGGINLNNTDLTGVKDIYGSASANHNIYGNAAVADATERSIILNVLDGTANAWLAVMSLVPSAANPVINMDYGLRHFLTASVTAAGQTLNAAPTAHTITAANAQAFTATGIHLVTPAITPAANGSGITMTGMTISQGAISNVADTEAITVTQLAITGAAGVALETGVYTWRGVNITIPDQAANAAVNVAAGLVITGGARAGAATATMRGIDITMAADADTAIRCNMGEVRLVNATGTSTLTVENASIAGNTRWTMLPSTNVASTDLVWYEIGNAGGDGARLYLRTGGILSLGTVPYATQVAGSLGLAGGLMIGANSLNNLIDDASNGAGSTAMYIGNAVILVGNGVNFGPAAVASITVVNGQITAIS